MNTEPHSFMDIFHTTFADGDQAVELRRIVIPIIQRDYAQGRVDPDIDRVRDRFLTALYDAVTGEPITLDFVYGDIDAEGTMTPLDGQQRLTTLFLLHWYAARRAGVAGEECAFLNAFGYETRYSARYFCEELTRFTPSFAGRLSEEIVDQAWFPLDWQRDPTVSSMLVMLDAIDERFKGVGDLWDRLGNGAITFYFLPIRDMGLTDELYIKMNSRGKPLTRFEHFKAELERCIRDVDEGVAGRVMMKIDRDWTDMLWQYRDSGEGMAEGDVTDDEFLRYFHFVCDVLCYKGGESPQGRSSDVFDLLSTYFTGEREWVLGNVGTLESYFDCWCDIEGHESPADFLDSCMSHESQEGKIVVDGSNRIDILEDCLRSYYDKSGTHRRFPLNRLVLLYAVTTYLRHQGDVPWPDFARRLRIVNNLIQNSQDEVSDRAERNRMPAILRQVDSVMLKGVLDDSIEANFNASQLAEEREKQAFIEEHPEKAAEVFALEDHPILKGQISIVGLDHIDYAGRFASLFDCAWDLVDCAMMAIGDYGQTERNGWRHQYGSSVVQSAWDALFHRSANRGFSNTSRVLVELLSREESFTDEKLAAIAQEFVASCEEASLYPWRYYYVKYPSFRPGSYGKLSNGQAHLYPYLYSVMRTRSHWSSNTYVPYFMEVDEKHLSRDSMGQRLVYGDKYIKCDNGSYSLMRKDGEREEKCETVPIRQNEECIDTEDRVLVLRRYIERMGLG